MAVVPDGGPEGTVLPEITPHNETSRDRTTPSPPIYDEKNPDIEVVSTGPDSDYDDAAKIYVPEDSEEFIDPRLKDCTCYICALADTVNKRILTYLYQIRTPWSRRRSTCTMTSSEQTHQNTSCDTPV